MAIEVKDVKMVSDTLTITIEVTKSLQELMGDHWKLPVGIGKTVQAEIKKKKVQVKKKPVTKSGKTLAEKAAYARERYAKRKAGNAPTVEVTGDDPSEDKMARMQKLQDEINEMEEDTHEIPERP